MKYFIFISILFLFFSCDSNNFSEVQGVYIFNQDSLYNKLESQVENSNAIVDQVLSEIFGTTYVEFIISNDSIYGYYSLVGEERIINSKLEYKNDSVFFISITDTAFIKPNKNGLYMRWVNAKKSLFLSKSTDTKLTDKTGEFINNYNIKIEENRKFVEKLGVWEKGSYVDEFGDRTGENYIYTFLKGSLIDYNDEKEDIFVKAWYEDKYLKFEFYNQDLSIKENFNEKFLNGMKLKFKDNTVETEIISSSHDYLYESKGFTKLSDYLFSNENVVKVHIDLRNRNNIYGQRYQFEISRNNLLDVLK